MKALQTLRQKATAVLTLAALNLLLAILAAAPLSPPLARALDDRPLAAAIADSADDAPRAELLQDHPELVSVTIETALLSLALWGLVSWIAAGGLLANAPFAVGCARHGRRMVLVGLAGLPLRLLALLGPLVAWPILDGARSFGSVVLGIALGVLFGGAMWSLTTVMIDRARGIALAQPELRLWRVIRAGVDASRRQRASTLLLAAISGLGFTALIALQLAITQALPPAAWAIAMAVGAIGATARAALSALTLFAAQPESQ